MNKLFKNVLLAAAAAAMLAACGGNDSPTSFSSSTSSSGSSSGSSTSSSSSGTSSTSSSSGVTSTAASITLISSAAQIQSNNSGAATVTAIVQNASNAILTGVPVIFSATSGVIAPVATSTSGSVAGTTDINGEAQATLSTPANESNRVITVTATVGTVSKSVTVAVVGTQLSLTGPSSLITGASGTFSVALTDSAGAGIGTAAVALTSANGNTLSASSLNTDGTGHATFTVVGVNAGNDTITATALGISATAALSVSGQNFSINSPAANTLVPLSTAQTVTLLWTNSGTPVANTQVSFSTTRGTFAGGAVTTTAMTNSSGIATVSLSSTTAGPALITASATGVSAQLSIQFVATTAASIDVQASPVNVAASGQSTISAIVWDAQNNLVQGQTVDFQLTDKTGGAISVATAVTNAQGLAQTVYQATTTPSSANGVVVTATVQSNTTISGSVDLTVGGQTLFLALGTGNSINPVGSTQYQMPWTVQALDASGNPVANVSISFNVHSFPYADIPTADLNDPTTGSTLSTYAAYAKGYWIPIPTSGNNPCNAASGTIWCQVVTAYCFNEDVNGSGILQSAEDINGNGRLDPGDVASVSPSSATTDNTGTAAVLVLYPRDHAEWVQVLLTASSNVAGTQSSTSAKFVLPINAADVGTTGVSPPGETSPYGTATLCTNPN